MDEYNKTNWVDGKTIVNADKLNKIEDQLAKLTKEKININDMQSKIEVIDLLVELLKDKQLSTNDFTDEYKDKLDRLQDTNIVTPITATSGDISIESNNIYRVTLSGNVSFVLPQTTDSTIFNQIMVQADVITDINATWGTNLYFGDAVTTLATGKYNFVFEHNGTQWIYGVIRIRS